MSSDVEKVIQKFADRFWRLNNLYYIIDKDGNRIKFEMNESQLFLYNNMWYLNLILKDRQRGFSTFIAIFMLDMCLFNSNTSAGIIDITLVDAKKKLGKIAYAYENLPEQIKNELKLTTDSKTEMAWSNGSVVSVSTSHRGGTLQILHISEMGKIASKFPERAREIRTGALNTLKGGNLVFNESTAEGLAGEFFDECQKARQIEATGEKLTNLDFKFHFFAWWMGEENEIDPDGVHISEEMELYFKELEQLIGRKISARKRAWYVKKDAQQKADMKREYPGTPDEAFEAAIEGAYLGKIMSKLYKKRRITIVPYEPGVTVNTGWDYGLNDMMTIWLHQRVGFTERIIGYIEGEDEDVTYYWDKLQKDFEYLWGYHFLPHDFGHRRGGTAKTPADKPRTLEAILIEAGMRNTKIIPKISDKRASINESKLFLPKVYIDKKSCEKGITCLQNFKREWDEVNAVWRDKPKHDKAMHGYDGFETLVRGLNAYGTIVDIKQKPKPIPSMNYAFNY